MKNDVKESTSQTSWYLEFHGNMCFSLYFGNYHIMFDPHDGISMQLPKPNVKQPADLILVSHMHFDHCNGVDLFRTDKTVVIKESPGYFKWNNFEIYGTEIKHGDYPNWGMNIAYSLRLPDGKVILHLGDIGYQPSHRELQDFLYFGTPDILILPIGGFFVIDAEQAFSIAKRLKPKITTLPTHYLYGPLLENPDFKGMETEETFMKLYGDYTKILEGNIRINEQYPDFVLLKPPI